jgi:2-polyprenyl-3-methyl-5-hydroxy-6-metoxy-1,4-benzoquinol methylase
MLMRRKAAIVMKGNRKNPDETMILEVGCSTGDLLAGLHRMEGIPVNNLFGIETNAKAAGIARSRGIRQIAESDLVDTLFDRKFDRIVFWHVLEHLHRPGETLKKTAGLLSPEGRLIVVLPNLDSFDAAHYGKGWIAYDAPRHLYNFTPASLTRLLAAYGFSIVSIRPYLPDSIYNAWHSEKLASELEGRRFGIRSGAAAALNAIRAILTGFIAEKASGIVCTAHRTDHDS